jgi:hypothetical protein
MSPELQKLQGDIEAILEANRLDWEDLARRSLPSKRRTLLQTIISARTADLMELLGQKWKLENQ